MTYPRLILDDNQMHDLFDKIDADGSGAIDKQEMIDFLRILLKH